MNLVCSTKQCHQNLCNSEVTVFQVENTAKCDYQVWLRLTRWWENLDVCHWKCFKLVCNLPCRYWSQKKAWTDGTLFDEWLHELDHKFEMQRRKVVMIVNNCPAHPEVSGLKAINLQFLLPNTTSWTLSMDQGVIRYVCFIFFLFYEQSQSNRNRMLRFCCRSSFFKNFFDYKDRSVIDRRKSWPLWCKNFFILRNATGPYQRIWDWSSN